MTATHELEVGAPAPDVELTGPKGKAKLTQIRGGKSIVIFFMRDFGCHTCVGHVLELSKAYDQIKALDAEVIVVGAGSVAAAQKLSERYKLPFQVFADTDHKAYDQFGLDKVLLYWQKSGSFVIDRDGKVALLNSGASPSASLDLPTVLKAIN